VHLEQQLEFVIRTGSKLDPVEALALLLVPVVHRVTQLRRLPVCPLATLPVIAQQVSRRLLDNTMPALRDIKHYRI